MKNGEGEHHQDSTKKTTPITKLIKAGNATRWRKGKSGNPNGRAKRPAEGSQEEITAIMLRLIKTDDTPHPAKVKYIGFYLELKGWRRTKATKGESEKPEEEISLNDFKLPPRGNDRSPG